ncbi:MAG: hypothetical protein HF976_15015 [ANME-2 cluster archaeon]|nr:hypothetical protein [ANME-2 cluster archaeon]MBC2702686.1 hypothetical protein [ANME-2 cluster archaeon]MBC2707965.1 hypothetical protein [ANME-2 cluster archaeon]MBC2746515.1 hypothetical protein [ANME-2 cluster archaeon]
MFPGFSFSVEKLLGSLVDMGSMMLFIPGTVLVIGFKLAPVMLLFEAAYYKLGDGTGKYLR